MRNLKKVLSLALAMVMLLGMMVVGAGAATEFKDDSDIPENRAVAVAVANKIEVLLGDENGNFKPDATLTRAEAAVVLTKLDLGADAAKALTATNAATFDDVGTGYGWAKAYIDYCAGNGYMVGVGGNRFAPAQTLTSVEFGLMVSRVLGYRDANEGIKGDDWSIKAAALARRAGLGTDVAVGSNPMTRADMAQMVLNALTAPMVEYEGMDITIGEVAITSKATHRTHTGSSASGVYNTTYNGELIQANITPIRLCEEKFPTLKLTTTENDDFGRTASVWTLKGIEIDGSNSVVEPNVTFTEEITKKADLWAKINTKAVMNKGIQTWINGNSETTLSLKAGESAEKIMDLTGNGRLVLVYLDKNDYTLIDKVVVVDTALGTVTKVDSAKETITIKMTESKATVNTPNLVTKVGFGEFKVDDLVLVQGVNADQAEGKFFRTDKASTDVKSVTAPEKVEGFATVRNNDKDGNGVSIVMEGTTYYAAYAEEKDTVKNFELNKKDDSTLYLDENGYIVKAVGYVAEKDPDDKLIAVSDEYQTIESGKLVHKVDGMLSNGKTVTWTYDEKNSVEVEDGNVYVWNNVNNKITLNGLETGKNANYTADTTNNVRFSSSESRGKYSANDLYYSDNVLFIFVTANGITKVSGVQNYSYNKTDAIVIAQALRTEKTGQQDIAAVFIQAEPDVADVSDIIFVHNKKANKDQAVDQEDGTREIRYGYAAYNSDAELIEDFLGDKAEQELSFIKKSLNADGSYKMNEIDKYVFTDKIVYAANGVSGNVFTVYDGTKRIDLVKGKDTKVLDLSDDGFDVDSIAQINRLVNNEGYRVTVYVIWNRTNTDGTYEAKAVFVTDVDTKSGIPPIPSADGVTVKFDGATLDTDFTVAEDLTKLKKGDSITITKKGDIEVSVVDGTGYDHAGNKVTFTAAGEITVKLEKGKAPETDNYTLTLTGTNLAATNSDGTAKTKVWDTTDKTKEYPSTVTETADGTVVTFSIPKDATVQVNSASLTAGNYYVNGQVLTVANNKFQVSMKEAMTIDEAKDLAAKVWAIHYDSDVTIVKVTGDSAAAIDADDITKADGVWYVKDSAHVNEIYVSTADANSVVLVDGADKVVEVKSATGTKDQTTNGVIVDYAANLDKDVWLKPAAKVDHNGVTGIAVKANGTETVADDKYVAVGATLTTTIASDANGKYVVVEEGGVAKKVGTEDDSTYTLTEKDIKMQGAFKVTLNEGVTAKIKNTTTVVNTENYVVKDQIVVPTVTSTVGTAVINVTAGDKWSTSDLKDQDVTLNGSANKDVTLAPAVKLDITNAKVYQKSTVSGNSVTIVEATTRDDSTFILVGEEVEIQNGASADLTTLTSGSTNLKTAEVDAENGPVLLKEAATGYYKVIIGVGDLTVVGQ